MSDVPPVMGASGGGPKEGAAAPKPRIVAQGDAAAHQRAVAALQGLAKPQPKANIVPEGGPELKINDGPMSGASGFVGILARRQPGPGDSHLPVAGLSEEEAQARRKRYALHMAKELGAEPAEDDEPEAEDLPLPMPAVPTVSPRMAMRNVPAARRRSPSIYVMIGMAALLLAIGLWAAGAIFYMQAVHPTAPSEVRYPLLRWEYDTSGAAAEIGAYARQSVMIAWAMLLCLPVGLAMGAGAVWMLRSRR